MKAQHILLTLLSLFLIFGCTSAQPEEVNFESSEFIHKKVNDNLYILKALAYNTNVGVLIGEDAILLVDPMTGTNNHQNLLDAIKQLSDRPIKYVLNTHSHMDHSGANHFFQNLGATIISHENASYSNAITDITFSDQYTFDFGSETVMLIHTKSHTIDDALIYFEKNNTLFMGDTYMTNRFPHYYYGGGAKGHIKMLDLALSLGNGETVIVPAHGNLTSNKNELSTYKQNSILWIEKIKTLYHQKVDDIANDPQIQELSTIFNSTSNVSQERLLRTIEKSISSDFIQGISLPENTLMNYEGKFKSNNDTWLETIFLDGKLYLRRQGFMFELLPQSTTTFHIKGQALGNNIEFDGMAKVTYFNGNAATYNRIE